jgi:hypothetical protein
MLALPTLNSTNTNARPTHPHAGTAAVPSALREQRAVLRRIFHRRGQGELTAPSTTTDPGV